MWDFSVGQSGVGVSRKQTLRLSVAFRMFIFKTSLEIPTYGREGWEAGVGTGKNWAVLQTFPTASVSLTGGSGMKMTLQNCAMKLKWPLYPKVNDVGCPWKSITMDEVALCCKGNSWRIDSWRLSINNTPTAGVTSPSLKGDLTVHSSCHHKTIFSFFLPPPSIRVTHQNYDLNSFWGITSTEWGFFME